MQQWAKLNSAKEVTNVIQLLVLNLITFFSALFILNMLKTRNYNVLISNVSSAIQALTSMKLIRIYVTQHHYKIYILISEQAVHVRHKMHLNVA